MATERLDVTYSDHFASNQAEPIREGEKKVDSLSLSLAGRASQINHFGANNLHMTSSEVAQAANVVTVLLSAGDTCWEHLEKRKLSQDDRNSIDHFIGRACEWLLARRPGVAGSDVTNERERAR